MTHRAQEFASELMRDLDHSHDVYNGVSQDYVNVVVLETGERLVMRRVSFSAPWKVYESSFTGKET